VEAVYCNLSKDEHQDNARFMAEVASWVGAPVKVLSHPKYESIDQCFDRERFMVGPMGAVCTRRMKRELREAYQQPDDTHCFGYTVEERGRIDEFEKRHPDVDCIWPLAAHGISKGDCFKVLQAAGIELPWMYRNGYDHNNCLGCVKGGKGYWNRIRVDFPDVFAKRAAQQRGIGCQFGGGDGKFWLDELQPDEGRDMPEPDIECGLFCGEYTKLTVGATPRSAAEAKENK
jgi:hypothetical protein